MDAKKLLKYCLYYSGFAHRSPKSLGHPKVWILRYHSVSDLGQETLRYVSPRIIVSPGIFESHIAFLSRNYSIISPDDVAAWISGTASLQRHAVVITFDDGYRDNYLYAYPVLRKYSATATFYVVTDAIGNAQPLWTSELRDIIYRAAQRNASLCSIGPLRVDLSDEKAREQTIKAAERIMRSLDKKARGEMLREIRAKLNGEKDGLLRSVMMNWDELREMKRAGMCISSHTMSHPLLTEISLEEAAIEITRSKMKIEEELGAPVAHFAYPNPGGSVHFNEAIKNLLREAGYSTARTSSKGSVGQNSDPFELNGISASNGCEHPALLAWVLDERVRSFRDSFAKFKRRTGWTATRRKTIPPIGL